MKRTLLLFISLVVGFELMTALFLGVYHQIYANFTWYEILLTLWHSLGNHLMVASCIMIPVALLDLVHLHFCGNWYRYFMMGYLSLASILLVTLLSLDIVLYGFWGFRLNLTPFVYILDNPITAMKESPSWAIWGTMVIVAGLLFGVYKLVNRLYPKEDTIYSMNRENLILKFWHVMRADLLLVILLALAWGGNAKRNLGMQAAYFSDEVLLCHAATNPVYSFFYALKRNQRPLDQQYHYYDDIEDVWQKESMINNHSEMTQDTCLLNTARPNILLVIFESFSGSVCHYLYPDVDPQIMPNVTQEMADGIAFTQLYANSFRTERGLVSILSAYPAQPTYSVMTDTLRCKGLDYLTSKLHRAGYSTQLMHGGDDDFCKLKHYLRCGEVEQNIGRYYFSPEEYDYPKGLHDEKMASFVYEQVHEATERGDRFLKIYTTMSSHEPFEVPFHRFEEPYLNSVAYADSCFGLLMSKLRADSAVWNKLLVIGLADHCCASWPRDVQQHHPLRYHIPMFWTGGAIQGGHRDVSTLCQQTDLTATLLSQMNRAGANDYNPIGTDEFVFSHDIFDPNQLHFAFYAWPDGFGVITDSCRYIQDNNHDGHALQGSNDPTGHAERLGKAYLQRLYDDLSERASMTKNQ